MYKRQPGGTKTAIAAKPIPTGEDEELAVKTQVTNTSSAATVPGVPAPTAPAPATSPARPAAGRASSATVRTSTGSHSTAKKAPPAPVQPAPAPAPAPASLPEANDPADRTVMVPLNNMKKEDDDWTSLVDDLDKL